MSIVDTENALELVPTGVKKSLLEFNSLSGAFIAVLPYQDTADLNTDLFTFVEADIDIHNQHVEGNITNWKIVNTNEAPIEVFESTIDTMAQDKVDSTYSIYDRLRMHERLLGLLLEAAGIEDEAYMEMMSVLDEIRKGNALRKEAYMNDPNYNFISRAEEAAINDSMLEGGVHIEIGPREFQTVLPLGSEV